MNYCPACGQKVEETSRFCSNCGQKLSNMEIAGGEDSRQSEKESNRTRTVEIERAEPTYYSDAAGIRITSTRVIIPGRTSSEGPSTYSMANITSVKTVKRGPSLGVVIVMAIIGACFIAAQYGFEMDNEILTVVGIVFIVVGLALAILLKPTYYLQIVSASGEIDALESKSKESIDRVVTAINEALIKRG
ncbi:MAG TPA: zinc ribbon domain-containing protein [Dehalococcoidia bacterium]|nr:zinc ribbon domain-containing protein [Dehalococcoidia bacterium]